MIKATLLYRKVRHYLRIHLFMVQKMMLQNVMRLNERTSVSGSLACSTNSSGVQQHVYIYSSSDHLAIPREQKVKQQHVHNVAREQQSSWGIGIGGARKAGTTDTSCCCTGTTGMPSRPAMRSPFEMIMVNGWSSCRHCTQKRNVLQASVQNISALFI